MDRKNLLPTSLGFGVFSMMIGWSLPGIYATMPEKVAGAYMLVCMASLALAIILLAVDALWERKSED